MRKFAQAWRALARRRAFTAAAVVTIGLGIGVTTAVFSLVDAIVLRPLPFPDADQLVTVYEAAPSRRERVSLVAPARIEDWNRRTRTFDAISGSYSENMTDTSGSEPERLAGRRVMPHYFDVFRMTPILGRTFVDAEELDGGPKAAVISEGYWTRRYGRAPDVTKRQLRIGSVDWPIVGVMPSTFASGSAFATTSLDVWLPAQLSPQLLHAREARFLGGVGRVKHGVSLDQARADLERTQRTLAEQFPSTDTGWGVEVRSLKDVRVGDYRRALILLLAAVALLLLIAVGNTAGLMLVQLRRRAPELAIRSAIGASRGQVVAAIAREVVLLMLLGGIVGTAIAVWLTQILTRIFADLPRVSEVRLDSRALMFAAVASFLAAMLFGLLPALHATRRHGAPILTGAARGLVSTRHRLQGTLVIAQIALSVLLTGVAGLLVRSYGALSRVETGFSTENVLTFHVGASWGEDRDALGVLQEQLVRELQRLPGVREAGFTNFLPATGATLRYQMAVDGLTGPDQNGMFTVGERSVTPGYLKALQVPLVAGEWCPDIRAGANAPRTALVNRRFVDQFAGGVPPIGRTARMPVAQSAWRIVGVVGDVIEDGPAAPVSPYLYVCIGAGAWPDPEYVVRTDGNAGAVASEIRQLVRRVDPARPLFGLRPVSDIVDASLDQPRLDSQLLSVFAGAALGLSALGLYGLLMLTIAERRREIGVRLALGASTLDVARGVLTNASVLVAIGVAAGLALTLWSAPLLRTVLFGVAPQDPRALGIGVLALIAVSMVAVIVPLRHATGVDPIDALRAE
jgi:predicted permease